MPGTDGIRHFAEITTKTPELYAFLRAMPKGGDLHSHMVGSAYSEEYIEWGIKEKCVSNWPQKE